MSLKNHLFLALLACLAVLFTLTTGAQEGPLRSTITVLNGANTGGDGDEAQCPLEEDLQRALVDMDQNVRTMLTQYIAALPPCGGPGWRRVTLLNITDESSTCPAGLSLKTSSGHRTCGRDNSGTGCSSTTFSVGGTEYSQVCGRIRGYQDGSTTQAFRSLRTLERNYVNGVSLTHGDPGSREHIWTFASGTGCACEGGEDSDSSNDSDSSEGGEAAFTPQFVGDDYFCESDGDSSNPLWDGQGCTSTSTCCQFNNPPRFTKNLPNPTTDDIELRVCKKNGNSETPIDFVELYVQ